MKNILVSLITVCYNRELTISDTIDSVLKQTYSNLEYIIIDGSSTDNTLNIIKSYKEKFQKKGLKFTFISEPDNGIYDAMNKGLKICNGELIGIINSDDYYEADALSKIVEKNDGKEFTIISGNINKVNSDKEFIKIEKNKTDISKYIFKTMPVNHPATFVHKTVYDKIGLFDTQYKLSADYDLVYRAFNASVNFLFINSVIVNMRNTGETHQTKNLFITAKEDYHIRKKNNVKWSSFYYLKRIGFNFLVIMRDNLLKKNNEK